MTHPLSTSPAKIYSLAEKEVGYHEGRTGNTWNNHQKYSPAVPGLEWSQGQAWCATFISWLALKANLSSLFPRTASTDFGANWYKSRKRWSAYPAVGAQGFLGKNGDMYHTFFVVDFDDTYVYTIEGNTNTSGSSQGDGVYRQRRLRRASNLAGYGYPAYPEGILSADPAWSKKPAPAPAKPKPKPSTTPNTDSAYESTKRAYEAAVKSKDTKRVADLTRILISLRKVSAKY